MSSIRAVMLEGSNGQSFFLKEILLTEGLANEVDLVSRAEQAIDLIKTTPVYSLIVINLVETWEQGMQLGFWLSQQPIHYPTILIIPAELEHRLPPHTPFTILSTPLSLQDFTSTVRTALQSKSHNHHSNDISNFDQLNFRN